MLGEGNGTRLLTNHPKISWPLASLTASGSREQMLEHQEKACQNIGG